MKREAPRVDLPSITLRPHSPERRLVRALARGEVAACCACCSCCCCLHSIGALAGAVTCFVYPREAADPGGKLPSAMLRDDELDGPMAAAPDRLPVPLIYMWSTFGVMVVWMLVAIVRLGPNGIPAGLGILIFFLPLVLLGGSALCALALACAPRLREEARAWKRLAWITFGILGGTLIGVILMLPLFIR